MLLELTRWLEQLQSVFGLFNYLTFRAILGALTALALSRSSTRPWRGATGREAIPSGERSA